MKRKIKVVLLVIGVVVSLPVIFFVTAMVIAPPGTFVIPPVSTYSGGITFSSYPGDALYDPILYFWEAPSRSYDYVTWKAVPNEDQCPLTITCDEKTWTADDFSLAPFLKTGAIDGRVEYQQRSEMTYRPKEDFWATYTSDDELLTISCRYQQDLSLQEVCVRVQSADKQLNTPDDKKSRLTISMGSRSVTLPANHQELVKGLGKPEKYSPKHTVRSTGIH